MTNLDSILKSRDVTLLTKVHLVKAIVFPVVLYGCENWTVKKAECQRIAAFELWCWRRLLRVNSRALPAFQESPRCLRPFQKNLLSLYCLDVHAEDRLTPPWHVGTATRTQHSQKWINLKGFRNRVSVLQEEKNYPSSVIQQCACN